MQNTRRSSSWGVLSIIPLNPLHLGEESPRPRERCCLQKQRPNSTPSWCSARAHPTFPRSCPQQSGQEGQRQLPAELRRAQHSSHLYFRDPEAITEVAAGLAGLTDSIGSAQSLAPTGHRALPSTSYTPRAFGGLRPGIRNSCIKSGTKAHSPARFSYTGTAQTGRGHCCTPSRSLCTRRDKDGDGNGELTPLTSRAASPALPPAPLGGVGHPGKENPPLQHKPGTSSWVPTHRWSCSVSS